MARSHLSRGWALFSIWDGPAIKPPYVWEKNIGFPSNANNHWKQNLCFKKPFSSLQSMATSLTASLLFAKVHDKGKLLDKALCFDSFQLNAQLEHRVPAILGWQLPKNMVGQPEVEESKTIVGKKHMNIKSRLPWHNKITPHSGWDKNAWADNIRQLLL